MTERRLFEDPRKALVAYVAAIVALVYRWENPIDPGVAHADFGATLLVGLLLSAASLVLSELLKPKPDIENAKPAGKGDFNFPTAEEGRGVPILFGKTKIAGPNVVWWGDFRQVPIREEIKTGLWSKKRVTTGFQYFVGIDMAICRGGLTPVTLEKVFVDDKELVGGTGSSVNLPDFLGGSDFGSGGLVGDVEFFPGSTTQTPSAYLSQFQDPISGQRGTAHYVWEGGWIGNSTQVPAFGFEVSRYPSALRTAAAAAGVAGDYTAGKHIVSGDANPMEVIYEAIVDNDWGMGKLSSKVDLENFAAAAAILHSEDNGFSLHFEREGTEIADALQLVQQQMDGVLYLDRRTGKFKVRLARQDYVLNYDVSSITGADTYNVASGGTDFEVGQYLFAEGFDNPANNGRKVVQSRTSTTITVEETLVNETPSGAVFGGPRVSALNGIHDNGNKVEIQEFSRQTWDGTTNQVRVSFTDRDRDYFDTFARADNLANLRAQGGEIVISTVSFPGCKRAALANSLAARELRFLSFPLAKATIVVNREFWDENPGSVVRWTNENAGFIDLAMRIHRFDDGETGSNITLGLVQDIFSLETGFFGDPPTTGWEFPTQEVAAIPANQQLVFEAPKAIVDRDVLFPGVPDRIFFTARAQAGEVGVKLYQRNDTTTPAGAYAEDGRNEGLMLIGTLNVALGADDANPTSTIQIQATPDAKARIQLSFDPDGATPAEIGQNLANLIMIGNEFIGVSGLSDGGGSLLNFTTCYRGMLDSVPSNHSSSALVYLLYVAGGLNDTQVPVGNFVDGQPRTVSRDEELDAGDAVTVSFQMDDRYRRPYPPFEMELNTARFGDPVNFDTQRPSTSGLDNRGIDVFFDRKDFRTTDEVFSLSDDAEALDASFPAANSTQYRIVVTDDPDGSPTVVYTGPWTGSTRNLFASRTRILTGMSTPGAIPSRLRVEIETRHTVDGDVLEGWYPLSWDFDLAASTLDNDTNLGNLSNGVSSATYTAPDTGTYTINIGQAIGGDVEVEVAGGGFVVEIAAGLTTGSFSASASDSIVVRHQDSGTPLTFCEIVPPTSSAGAYAILVD